MTLNCQMPGHTLMPAIIRKCHCLTHLSERTRTRKAVVSLEGSKKPCQICAQSTVFHVQTACRTFAEIRALNPKTPYIVSYP